MSSCELLIVSDKLGASRQYLHGRVNPTCPPRLPLPSGHPLQLPCHMHNAPTVLPPTCPCPQGGATRFNHLDLAVRPTKGTAVLFFPAFADGVSDVRCGGGRPQRVSVQEAEPAVGQEGTPGANTSSGVGC